MDMLSRLLQNHVLANLSFILVLIVGGLAFGVLMPKEKDPEINFNWVVITTTYPGASATDVEKRITNVLEEAIERVQDVRFVSSYSNDNFSNILLRFEQIDERTFDRRMTTLRAELQNKSGELPEDAEDPTILEITSSNGFPTAVLVAVAESDDENLRLNSRLLEQDMERLSGVDRVDVSGLKDPEIQVLFRPDRLAALGLNPSQIADSVNAWYRDLAAGRVDQGRREWALRIIGKTPDPNELAEFPLTANSGGQNANELLLKDVADVATGRAEPSTLVRYAGKPGAAFFVYKQAGVNTIELMDRLTAFVDERNDQSHRTGITLKLADDQTVPTREALSVMQRNAAVGLVLVMIVTWVFLGTRIAIFTTIGLPFTLAGTFLILWSMGMTLNTNVLLGVVIGLGMLVDDAVVVVEGIHHRITRGMDALSAALASLKEVFSPVTTSVMTTMAAFLPLMLLPGILGEFMKVIPMVVTLALALSLFEAYWMLPAHVIVAGVGRSTSRLHSWRERFTHSIRVNYCRMLIRFMRRPRITLGAVLLMMAAAISALAAGRVHVDFFALESYRVFYVNVTMPPGTRLEKTMDTTVAVERAVMTRLDPGDARAVVSWAGQQFTQTGPQTGNALGQVMVSLNPKTPDLREVDDVVDAVREVINDVPGPARAVMFPLKDGPPTGKAISVKVRGDDYEALRKAADEVTKILNRMEAVSDITDDANPGPMTLSLKLDTAKVHRAGLNPVALYREVRLLGDGEIVATLEHAGDDWDVRVRSATANLADMDSLLRHQIVTPSGERVALGSLLEAQRERGLGQIRHYNFRRAITLEAELDKTQMDVITANENLKAAWAEIAINHPGIDLDFSGELDDIQESMDAIAVLFLFGVGLIYVILGTQFRSYFQPLMILMTVPMAFTGVVAGLLITQHPLSLYTMYGVVALAGISVNSAIVLISAANQRLEEGMSLLHATIYAARRRVIPIMITALTTIAGLFSLATGLGGKSLLWGPVATAIVWGLAFSTVLTLIVVPILYRLSMSRSPKVLAKDHQTELA